MTNEILRLNPDEVTRLFTEGEMEVFTTPAPNIEQARSIFGRDFLGPEAIEQAFDIKIPSSEIPEIPFSQEELERAKKLGQFLILRVRKTSDGEPLTILKMLPLIEDYIYRERKEDFFKPLWGNTNTKDRPFSVHTPKSGWALILKGVIPGSTNKNYLEQTDVLSDYLRRTVFAGTTMPTHYKDAIDEFNSKKEEISNLTKGSLTEARALLQLKLNKLNRQTSVEAVYDIAVYFLNNDSLFSENTSTWTTTLVQTDSGKIISVGVSLGGITIGESSPNVAYDQLGVTFSRYL